MCSLVIGLSCKEEVRMTAKHKKLTKDELMQVGGHLAPDEMAAPQLGTFALLMELVENPPPAPPALRKLLRGT